MNLMENAEHLWKMLDFEMDIMTGEDTGLPLLGKGKVYSMDERKSEEIFDNQRVDRPSPLRNSEITFPSLPCRSVWPYN